MSYCAASRARTHTPSLAGVGTTSPDNLRLMRHRKCHGLFMLWLSRTGQTPFSYLRRMGMKGCLLAHPYLWAILTVPSASFHGKSDSERNPA